MLSIVAWTKFKALRNARSNGPGNKNDHSSCGQEANAARRPAIAATGAIEEFVEVEIVVAASK